MWFGTISGTHNLIGVGVAGGPSNGVDFNQVGNSTTPKAPKLSTLGDDGGATRTHKLLSDSTAIDAGDNDYIDLYELAYDQRGFDRTSDDDSDDNDIVDIGAFELAFEEF